MGVKEFIESISKEMDNMDLNTLEPTNHMVFHPLFDKEWIERIEKAISNLKGVPAKKIAESFTGLSHLRCQMMFILKDMKTARIPRKKRIKIANFFDRLVNEKAKSDPYGYKSNIMQTKEEIKEILKKDFSPGNPEKAREIAKFYNAVYHFVNGLYSDFYTDYGAENFGPFNLGNERIMVIKHFEDLFPREVWKGLKVPFKKVTIYSILENVGFSCRAISAHTIYDGNPVNGLREYRIEVDGKTVNNMDEIIRLRKIAERLADKQWKWLTSLDKEELKKKLLLIKCYINRGFFKLANMDWKPDKKLLNAIKGKDFAFDAWKLPKGSQMEYWKKVMDPESEFYGK